MAAWTRVSASSKPGWYAGSDPVRPTMAAMWPPAEPPVTAMKEGSTPSSPACSRIQAMARLTSTRCSGQVAPGLRR
jgi:hypothetical protein